MQDKETHDATHQTLNREAIREYEALKSAEKRNTSRSKPEEHSSSTAGQCAAEKNSSTAEKTLIKKNSEQQHRLASERELMKYPNELSQLVDRMASDSWQG